MQIQFTKQAEGDLEDIWNYTLETWGHRQAERYIGDIQRSLAEISSHPHRIKKPFPQNKNVESFKVNHHFVFMIRDEKITKVIGILHERMDLVRQLHKRLG